MTANICFMRCNYHRIKIFDVITIFSIINRPFAIIAELFTFIHKMYKFLILKHKAKIKLKKKLSVVRLSFH